MSRFDGTHHETFTDEALREEFKRIPLCKKTAAFIYNGESPAFEDLLQGRIGDCYLISALKAIVLRSPELIKDIITPLPDGKVEVRLYSIPSNEPGAIHKPYYYTLDATQLKGPGHRHRAPWVSFIEQAYALHREHIIKRKVRGKTIKNMLDGGMSSESFECLLGVKSRGLCLAHKDYMESYIPLMTAPIEMPLPFIVPQQTFVEFKETKEHFSHLDPDSQVPYAFLKTMLAVKDYKDVLPIEIFENEQLRKDFIDNFPYDQYEKYYQIVTQYTIFNQNKLRKILKSLKQETVNKIIEYLNSIHKDIERVLYEEIAKSLESGEFVCAGTMNSSKLLNGLVRGHAYHVINLRKVNGEVYVELDNPWGSRVPKSRNLGYEGQQVITYGRNDQRRLQKNKGVFVLSLHDFISYFDHLYVTDLEGSLQQAREHFEVDLNSLEGIKEKHALLMTQVSQAPSASPDSGLGESDSDSDVSDTSVLLASADDELQPLLAVNHEAQIDRQEDLSEAVNEPTSISSSEDLDDRLLNQEAINQVIQAREQAAQQSKKRYSDHLRIKASATAKRGADSDGIDKVLGSILKNIESYVKSFDTENFAKQNIIRRAVHRLGKRGEGRYISEERQQRAQLISAIIRVFNSEIDGDDQNLLIHMLLKIKDRHDKDTTRINRFHGNRLGKILEPLKYVKEQLYPPSRFVKTLSAETAAKLQAALSEHGFDYLRAQSTMAAHYNKYEQIVANLAGWDTKSHTNSYVRSKLGLFAPSTVDSIDSVPSQYLPNFDQTP